ncbi:hypothetical protein, partial [uncultured Alistipes sp.]|uniref:hypothetical protein n=1 Tax=uncultured Alistipes sp. TaxID=538949 RepID=UPI0025AF9762
ELRMSVANLVICHSERSAIKHLFFGCAALLNMALFGLPKIRILVHSGSLCGEKTAGIIGK